MARVVFNRVLITDAGRSQRIHLEVVSAQSLPSVRASPCRQMGILECILEPPGRSMCIRINRNPEKCVHPRYDNDNTTNLPNPRDIRGMKDSQTCPNGSEQSRECQGVPVAEGANNRVSKKRGDPGRNSCRKQKERYTRSHKGSGQKGESHQRRQKNEKNLACELNQMLG